MFLISSLIFVYLPPFLFYLLLWKTSLRAQHRLRSHGRMRPGSSHQETSHHLRWKRQGGVSVWSSMEDTQLFPTHCCPRRTTLYLSHSGQHAVPGVNMLLPHALSQTQTSRTDTHAYNMKLYFPPPAAHQTMFKVVKVIGCPRLDWITKF